MFNSKGHSDSGQVDGPSLPNDDSVTRKLRRPMPMYRGPHQRKTGADSCESTPVSVVSFERRARLEREPGAELAPDRAWDNDAVRVDEPDRMAKRGSAGDVAAEVVAVIAAIRQVECLGHQLQVHAFAEFDVLRQPHVEFKEWISTKRIVLGDGAPL